LEKVIVYYDRQVVAFLNNLASVLLRKEYFSYQENAEEYVTKITLQIENDLHFTKFLIKLQKNYCDLVIFTPNLKAVIGRLGMSFSTKKTIGIL
jgi:hypothetical protein